jgi:hypothetical protein
MNETNQKLEEIEAAQEKLRENIEESKKLVAKTQQLLKSVSPKR